MQLPSACENVTKAGRCSSAQDVGVGLITCVCLVQRHTARDNSVNYRADMKMREREVADVPVRGRGSGNRRTHAKQVSV